jgi:signal recognition particle subunit SEC65
MKYKEFACIWPTYIDGTKTMKEGRRVSQDIAVGAKSNSNGNGNGNGNNNDIDSYPTIQDISEVLQSMNVRHAIQPYKGYPRDVESRWYNPGRILYDLDQMSERMSGTITITNDASTTIDVDDVPVLNDDNDKVMTQKECWKLIASKVESMPGRIARKLAQKKALEEEVRKERARKVASAKSSKANKNTGGGSNKKKGKKKR